MSNKLKLKHVDPEVYNVIHKEENREHFQLELIASENFTSPAVLEAQGSILTNKYAEGYPGRRWYGGCCYVDEAETIAMERARLLFKAEYANVQPHSGSQANMAVYFSSLKIGDTIMGMDLAQGGHLTHGSPVNFSGIYFNIVSYGVNRTTEMIDYKEIETLAKKHMPKMIIAGASAYPRKIDFKEFKRISEEIGAVLLVDMAHIAGLVAAGLHPNPAPLADFVTSTTHKTLRGPRGGFILCKKKYGSSIDKMVFPGIQGGPLMHVIAAKAVAFKEAQGEEFKAYQNQVIKNTAALGEALKKRNFRLVSGGTDTHLLLIDLSGQEVSGKEAEEALDKAGISVNKNNIPYDTKSPFITSGIRLGTAAVTTRGLKEGEMEKISFWIDKALSNTKEEKVLARIKGEVNKMCHRFPLYKVKECKEKRL